MNPETCLFRLQRAPPACWIVLLLLVASISGCKRPTSDAGAIELDADSVLQTLKLERLQQNGDVENLLRLTQRIYSGGEPDTAAAMKQLSDLGIKTLLSVDGARPNVELAADYGMRYVHVPIGYDGVSADAAAALNKAVREVEGPIFVHCHHGQHRGPAAAAICVITETGIKPKQAAKILETAGTSRDYAGLWRDVSTFKPRQDTASLPDLVETASVDSFVAAMASLGRAHDHLKLLQQNAWVTPVDHPDLVAAQQALILYEGFQESIRFLQQSNPYDSAIATEMAASVQLATTLQTQLESSNQQAADTVFVSLQQACKQCHADYRN